MSGANRQFNQMVQVYQLPFFYSAFHPYQTLVIVPLLAAGIGYFSGAAVTYGVTAFFFAPVVWAVAVIFTNSNYQELSDAFLHDAAAKATEIFAGAGKGTETYYIKHSYDAVNFVRPDRVHEPVVLIVSDASMLVYDDARLDFDRLYANFGTSSREFFFDSVASMNYDKPYFEIRLQDGERVKYRSSRKPDDVLHDLQQRLRSYKARPEVEQ